MTEAIDVNHLRQWIGRTEEKTDVVTAHLVAGLRSALFLDVGKPKAGDAAPFTAHWCLTLPVVPMSEVGPDGHPTRGGFLPPVPLPRRMWAGGEISFIEPLRVGDVVTRTSTIKDLNLKSSRRRAASRRASAMTSSIARCPPPDRTPPRPSRRPHRLPPNIPNGISPIPCCCFAIRR
jgi:hydroxyacyl-ACP dehydratase HTD2-like protein with hotdog domain